MATTKNSVDLGYSLQGRGEEEEDRSRGTKASGGLGLPSRPGLAHRPLLAELEAGLCDLELETLGRERGGGRQNAKEKEEGPLRKVGNG